MILLQSFFQDWEFNIVSCVFLTLETPPLVMWGLHLTGAHVFVTGHAANYSLLLLYAIRNASGFIVEIDIDFEHATINASSSSFSGIQT